MAAKSRRVHEHRLQNIAAHPDIGLSQCPKCGGTEWALTELAIGTEGYDDLNRIERNWFERFLDWLWRR